MRLPTRVLHPILRRSRPRSWRAGSCLRYQHLYGHKGTDFRLRNLDLMDRGIDVIAAATGRVHDGMRDVHMRLLVANWPPGGALAIVVIDHGDGWRTLYGHMRRGSVAVKTGDTVVAGQRLVLSDCQG